MRKISKIGWHSLRNAWNSFKNCLKFSWKLGEIFLIKTEYALVSLLRRLVYFRKFYGIPGKIRGKLPPNTCCICLFLTFLCGGKEGLFLYSRLFTFIKSPRIRFSPKLYRDPIRIRTNLPEIFAFLRILEGRGGGNLVYLFLFFEGAMPRGTIFSSSKFRKIIFFIIFRKKGMQFFLVAKKTLLSGR